LRRHLLYFSQKWCEIRHGLICIKLKDRQLRHLARHRSKDEIDFQATAAKQSF
jgi:hypothetical protein